MMFIRIYYQLFSVCSKKFNGIVNEKVKNKILTGFLVLVDDAVKFSGICYSHKILFVAFLTYLHIITNGYV